LKEETWLQLQRRFLPDCANLKLRQIVHIYPSGDQLAQVAILLSSDPHLSVNKNQQIFVIAGPQSGKQVFSIRHLQHIQQRLLSPTILGIINNMVITSIGIFKTKFQQDVSVPYEFLKWG
jgi:hypothetical protein